MKNKEMPRTHRDDKTIKIEKRPAGLKRSASQVGTDVRVQVH